MANTVQPYISQLLNPQFWGSDVKEVRLIQTHTSWVFLTGKYAYKIKKPVFFGFLDYTSISAREYFCNEEFRINQKLSPEIYYGIIPIYRKGNLITITSDNDPSYEIIDYAIKMAELPQEAIMTYRLQNNQVTYSTIAKIAETIARFHNETETQESIRKFGSLEIIKYNWDENFAQTEEFRNITISKKIFSRIQQSVEKFMTENQKLFNRRLEDNKIKQCHGDLHSRNIFVTNKVYIFDCLEFNPRFACSDVASEVAFFVMDLEFYNHKELADFFIARYLHYTKDWEMLKLLDFYKCYRAYVRGKVTSFNLKDPGISNQDKKQAQTTAQSYFELAFTYAQNLFTKPKLIMIMGLPGVGKTYLAQHLSKEIQAYHLCTDIIRKEITNTPIEVHRFEGYGKGIYTFEVSKQTYEEMYHRTVNYLKQNRTCIVDATFSLQKSRDEVKAIAKKTKVPLITINAVCPEPIVMARMKKRENEFSLSDATPEIYYKIKENFNKIKSRKNYLEIDTSKSLTRNIQKIKKLLKKLSS
ncbi:MAG: AAA family ATPase [candidate division WOR-3 bacterium]|nr:AAA family ATPase [candidate division WOR-3 bacterium]